MLRPRYRPGWVPSWEGTKDESPYGCEDSVLALVSLSKSVGTTYTEYLAV